MVRKKKPKKLKTFLIPKLRSASLYWDRRQQVYDRIRVDRGKYACESCGEIVSRKEIDIDHIEPIINLETGWTDDWGAFILALFCEADGLQGICKPCHSVKTMQEDEMRKYYKQKKKDETLKKLNEETKARKESKKDDVQEES